MDKKNETQRLPYSYHTFIFPFLFEFGKEKDRKSFLKCLPALGEYLYEDAFDPKFVDKASYDAYRYFNQSMRNAVYSVGFRDSDIVWNYRYDIERMAKGKDFDGTCTWLKNPKNKDNPVVLAIKKEKFYFRLAVNGVRLKLFNTGVGMLIFELENYEHYSEKCIIRINEFGRRVYMPFARSIDNTENPECHLCADEIRLYYGNELIENASGRVSGTRCTSVDEIELAPIIKYFLSNGKKKITTAPTPKRNEFRIEPIIDDRMFVACLYGNADFGNDMGRWDDAEKTYKYLSDSQSKRPGDKDNLARRLYEMMFVDGDGMSCHNREMLKSMLEKHIYARWLEYGTITGISEYSLISVTSGMNIVVLPFLAEYIELLILVLAQRASLLAFERLISEVVCEHIKCNMEKVQKKYVKFQSELLLQEVTAQQQGIEIYNMLLENLFINQQQSGVENQIKSLFEINSATNERKENWILFLLAVLGISEVVQIVNDWIGAAIYDELKISCPLIDKISQYSNFSCFIISVLIAVVFFLWRNLGKKGLK